MTRKQERRRKRRRRMRGHQIRRIGAWTLLILAELSLSAVPAALSAAVVIPLAQMERGYMAAGSEWLAVAVVFCIAHGAIHNLVCNRIYRKG